MNERKEREKEIGNERKSKRRKEEKGSERKEREGEKGNEEKKKKMRRKIK